MKMKKADGEDNVDGRHPSADFDLLLAGVLWLAGLQFVEGDIGGETEGAESERHGVAQSDYAADDRPAHPFMLFGKPLQRFAVGGNFARRLAARDCPGVRRAHHNALEHGLAADQGLLAALQRGQELDRHQESQPRFQKPHMRLDDLSLREVSGLRIPQAKRNSGEMVGL